MKQIKARKMKILQITAAPPGWYAHCRRFDDDTTNHYAIAAWAITEYTGGKHPEEGITTVEALVISPRWPGLLTIEQAIIDAEEEFTGYCHKSATTPIAHRIPAPPGWWALFKTPEYRHSTGYRVVAWIARTDKRPLTGLLQVKRWAILIPATELEDYVDNIGPFDTYAFFEPPKAPLYTG